MQREEYLAQLRRDGDRIIELADGDLGIPVPTCPGWTLADLVRHTGYVHRWHAVVLRDDTDGFPDPATWRERPAEGEPIGRWFRAGLDEAIDAMSAVDPDAPRWTLAGPGTAAWYPRRAAHETLVHRIDAELAAGVDPAPVEPRLAVDGVDEMCDVFIPMAAGQPVGGDGETLHLHATDSDGEWLLTLQADRVEVARGHAKGDAAVRAEARDLLFLVWGREPIGEHEVFGDASIVERFRAAAAI